MSSDSSTVKQETSFREQSKANNTIINRKDKVERPQDQARGPATVEKIPLSKDLPLNNNVTQSTEKKSNGTLKVLIKLPKGTKESANVTVKTNSEKGKLSLFNVTSTENAKKPSRDSVTNVLKGGASVIQKGERHANATEELKGKDKKQHKDHEKNMLEKHLHVTTSTEKDKKPIKESVKLFKEESSEKTMVGKHSNVSTSTEKSKKPSQDSVTLYKERSTEKKLVEKHSDVSSSIEKDKKPSQGNITQPKAGSSEKKMVEKLLNVTTSIEKDRTLRQSNNLPKDGSSGKRKVDRFLNVTAANNKDKKLPEDDETTSNIKATPGNKTGKTHVNVTASTEKDKTLNQGNVTPLKEASLGKTKVDKHLNVTKSTEKDRKNQSNVTPLKEKTSGMRNVTTSSEKRKKLVPGNETKILKVTPGRKAAQRHVNITTSTGKDNKLHQGNVTLLKDESSRKTKLDSHLSVTTSIEKDKKLLQSNETKVLNNVTAEKKRVDKHLNVTTFTEKDNKLCKSDTTLIKEGSSQKGKVDNVNVKKSNEKGKKLLQGDETTVLTKVIPITEEKDVNATTTSEKDKNLPRIVKEDTSRKNKENSALKNITISKTHAERTTKLIDIGPVEVHNITSTGFVITWEAPQGLFRNFTVTRREVWSGRSDEHEAEEDEKSQDGDKKADELYSTNRTSSKVYSGKADRKSAEKFSQVLAGSARSYHFKNLRPQRKYSVSLFSSGPRVRSKVHRLLVSTGK